MTRVGQPELRKPVSTRVAENLLPEGSLVRFVNTEPLLRRMSGASREQAAGTLDATTGVPTQTLPLDSTVYATGDLDGPGEPIQPCPKCVNGLCDFGPNAGMACTPSGSLATSHDCPPPGSPLPTFGVDLSPLGTGTVTASAADGLFCSATTGQLTLGCFGDTTCRYMEENGSPAGDLLDGLPHDGILGSVFCIPATGSALIDAIADLPGTGAVSLTGELSLVFGTSRPTTTTAAPTTTTTTPTTTTTSSTTTTLPPLSCLDPSRTIHADGIFRCRELDGDPDTCALAWAITTCRSGRPWCVGQPIMAVSCYYDVRNRTCQGCGPKNQDDGDCVNTCP